MQCFDLFSSLSGFAWNDQSRCFEVGAEICPNYVIGVVQLNATYCNFNNRYSTVISS